MRQRLVRKIVFAGHDEIDVTRQREVLKAVVQDVDRGVELRFREAAARVPIRADDDAHALRDKRSREHQRLVARGVDRGDHLASVRHDGRTGARRLPSVSA